MRRIKDTIIRDKTIMTAKKRQLTVIIPTYNVEDLIAQAIESVLWADEIFVVDSFSTDRTVEIAQSYGARVVQHEYIYSAKQKNWAIPQAKNEWILLLDSDEVVTPELRTTIEKLLADDTIDNYDGFGIARKHFFLGKFLRWGGRYPLYNIRLFHRSCRYEDRNVHAHIILDKERMAKISGDILHFSDRSLDQFFEKFNRYSTWHANYMLRVYRSGMTTVNWKQFLTNPYYAKAIIKDLWTFIPFTPMIRFLYMYVFRLGVLDGRYGFMIAFFYAFQDYVAKTKYLEMRKMKPRMRLTFQKYVAKSCASLWHTQTDHINQYVHDHFSIKSNKVRV
jgi:glycosyltransferase involved in cell wall biosynthesis